MITSCLKSSIRRHSFKEYIIKSSCIESSLQFSTSTKESLNNINNNMPSKYPNLLSPITLRGGNVLKNRSLMGSMHTGLEEPGGFFKTDLNELAEFYAHRARGNIGLIVTGGISPNNAGRVYLGAAKMSNAREAESHRLITDTVHKNNGKIAMQILHSGRYGYHLSPVSASAIKAPIGLKTPYALSRTEVYGTIDDFVHTSQLAQSVGYDGVEIMGSEGYFINQFLSLKTNKRTDEWGGSYANRMRLPVEIVKRVRQATSEDFIIVYRLSMLDLVDNGQSWEEIVELALNIENAGASIINTGIGWHESRIPTIATMVSLALTHVNLNLDSTSSPSKS